MGNLRKTNVHINPINAGNFIEKRKYFEEKESEWKKVRGKHLKLHCYVIIK